jgi:hypothetical protein
MGEYRCSDSDKTNWMIARTNVALLHAFDTIVSMIGQAAFHFKLVMAPPIPWIYLNITRGKHETANTFCSIVIELIVRRDEFHNRKQILFYDWQHGSSVATVADEQRHVRGSDTRGNATSYLFVTSYNRCSAPWYSSRQARSSICPPSVDSWFIGTITRKSHVYVVGCQLCLWEPMCLSLGWTEQIATTTAPGINGGKRIQKFQNCPLFLFAKNLNRDAKKRLMDVHPNYEQQQKLPPSTQQPKPLLFVVNSIAQPSVSFSLHMIAAPTCPHMMQLFSSYSIDYSWKINTFLFLFFREHVSRFGVPCLVSATR